MQVEYRIIAARRDLLPSAQWLVESRRCAPNVLPTILYGAAIFGMSHQSLRLAPLAPWWG